MADVTDTSLAYAGLGILCLFGGCIIGYIFRVSCVEKPDITIKNGSDSLLEV